MDLEGERKEEAKEMLTWQMGIVPSVEKEPTVSADDTWVGVAVGMGEEMGKKHWGLSTPGLSVAHILRQKLTQQRECEKIFYAFF